MESDKAHWLSRYSFHPVIKLPEKYYIHDFSRGKEDLNPWDIPYSVGKYNEHRPNMYVTEMYEGEQRDIHMGVDIAAPVSESIFNFYDGEVFLFANNNREGDYGPTIIMKYSFDEGDLYALFGHLSLCSIENINVGQRIGKGEVVARIGSREVNGNWFPHLHFQLCWKPPKEANIQGVVSRENHREALEIYPDPRLVLGPIF